MMHHQDYFSGHSMQESKTATNLPTTMGGCEEETINDSDEPPDERQEHTPRAVTRPPPLETRDFNKKPPNSSERKESLLTQALHTSPTKSESGSGYDRHNGSRRGCSTASTCSTRSATSTELTSDASPTSPDTRTSSPSPPPPTTAFQGLPPIFSKPFLGTVSIRPEEDTLSPLQKPSASDNADSAVEATLGRKRCITFACGRKDVAAAPPAPITAPEPPKESPPKRTCTIKFACPSKVSTDGPTASNKPRVRAVSPAPVRKQPVASPRREKPQRGSDATIRNNSPKASRKPAKPRRFSENSDIGRSEATRFAEFRNSSDEQEDDDWVQESTCFRSRLTVQDTLKVEYGLRRLAEEVEEEAVEDEEDDEDEDELEELEDEDEDDEDEDDEDDADDEDAEEEDEALHSSGYVSEGGFQTDDEEGFAGSDTDSDAGSDYRWWAPGASTTATSIDALEHIRSLSRKSISESSINSDGSGSEAHHKAVKSLGRKRSRAVKIKPDTPELPDSTDFVCGTLDEDRPLEEAYISQVEARRAAKRKATPQDIDPTFPTSDPELDEEDDDDVDDLEDIPEEESDAYMFMHGQPDPHDDPRGRRHPSSRRHSPNPSPRRLRSPPSTKRNVAHRSPPPRRLFGGSPPKRLRSPPAGRLRSPPPTRRTSYVADAKPERTIRFNGLAECPRPTLASSVPKGIAAEQMKQRYFYEEEEDEKTRENLIRGAIDIRAGLERKRQRRKERLYQKHCRKACKDKDRTFKPGKGASRMREMGLELAAYKGKGAAAFTQFADVRMLSY